MADAQNNTTDSTDVVPQETTLESDHVREAREHVAALRLKLNSTSDDDVGRYVIMYQVAVAIGNHHDAADVKGEGELPIALELAQRAESLAPEGQKFEIGEDDYRGMAINTQMTLCSSLFWSTDDLEWLGKAIDAGERLIFYMKETKENMYPVVYRFLYSKRCERLAKAFLDLYEYRGSRSNEKVIARAAWHQGQAADNTIPDELRSGGELLKWNRASKFVDMKVMEFYFSTNEGRCWNDLIGVLNYFPHRLCLDNDDVSLASTYNYYKHITVLARRWADTRQASFLDELLAHMQEYARRWTVNNKSYYNEDSRDLLLLMATKTFMELTGESTTWVDHLPSIDVAIALWKKLKPADNMTVGNVYKMREPVGELMNLYQRRYNITLKGSDGLAFDDLASAHSRLKFAVLWLDEVHAEGERGNCDKPYVPDPSQTTVSWKTSIIGQRQSLIADIPSLDFTSHRLQFFQEDQEDKDWKPTIENWVRERTEDGEYILGGAVEGKDDDVIEFVRNWGVVSTGPFDHDQMKKMVDANYRQTLFSEINASESGFVQGVVKKNQP